MHRRRSKYCSLSSNCRPSTILVSRCHKEGTGEGGEVHVEDKREGAHDGNVKGRLRDGRSVYSLELDVKKSVVRLVGWPVVYGMYVCTYELITLYT